MEKDYDFDERNQFTEDILKMLERGSPNDVQIKLSDGDISANKDILMARSEYFSTMLSNNKFMEGKTSTVDMTHCSKAVMEKIIQFLFIGAVKTFSGLSLDQLLELSHMSRMMLLDNLQERVEDYATNKINRGGNDDVSLCKLLSALKLAIQYSLENMVYILSETLLFKLDDILGDAESSDFFKSLPFSVIREILLFDLTDSCPDGRPTTKLKFDTFTTWLSKNEVTEEQEDEIRESFDFEDFTVKELMTSVRYSGLYTDSKIDERVLDLFKRQKKRVEHQRKLLKENDKSIKEKDKSIKEKAKAIKEKDKHIKELEEVAKERGRNVKAKDDLLILKDKTIGEKNLEIQRLRSPRLFMGVSNERVP